MGFFGAALIAAIGAVLFYAGVTGSGPSVLATLFTGSSGKIPKGGSGGSGNVKNPRGPDHGKLPAGGLT